MSSHEGKFHKPFELNEHSNGENRDKKIDRRGFLKSIGKVALGAAAFEIISHTGSPSLEATELREGMKWKEGLEALMKDVFESPVETMGSFIHYRDGTEEWRMPTDEKSSSVAFAAHVEIILRTLEDETKRGGAEEISFTHSHPLTMPEKDRPDWLHLSPMYKEDMMQGHTTLLSFPSSRTDLDTFVTMFEDNKHMREITSRVIISGTVVEPTGVWKYHLDPDASSAIRAEEKRLRELAKDLSSRIQEYFPKVGIFESSEEGKILRGDKSAAQSVFTAEEMQFYEQYLNLSEQRTNRQNTYLKMARVFINASLKGAAAEQLREKLINAAYAEYGIRLSYTSYQELGLSYGDLHKR